VSRKSIITAVPVALLSVSGCGSTHSHATTQENIREITSPAPTRAFSPRVTAMLDASTLLTWLEPTNDKVAALRYSFWRDGAWSTPATIVSGQPFSRHPSESPGVVALSKKTSLRTGHRNRRTRKFPLRKLTCISPSLWITVYIGQLQI
jgi:hypothetical protein